MSCGIPGPARLKGFSVPLSRVIAREYEKALCACASFYVCFFLSAWKCINSNSICPVFLRTSMRWRFSLLIELDWGGKLQLLSYEISGQGLSQLLSRADSTVGFFFDDSSIYQIHPICKIAIFRFPHSLGAKDTPDSLVSKRWKYRMIKSNFLGLQSKLAESDGLSVLEND